MWLTKLIEGLLGLLDLPISRRTQRRVACVLTAVMLLFPAPALLAVTAYEMRNLAPATNLINIIRSPSTTTTRRT